MHIEADRKKLIECLSSASAVAPRRSPKEILTRLLLHVEHDATQVLATDMEMSVSLDVPCVVKAPGKALIPPQAVAVLRQFTDSTVTLAHEPGKLSVSCGGANLSFGTENPDEFPCPRFISPESPVVVSSEILKQIISRTTYACDKDSTRFALGGVLFTTDGKELIAVATDGRRLSKLSVETATPGAIPTGCIVPESSLTSIAKLGIEGDVMLWCTSNDFCLSADGVRVMTRLVEGRFPNWQQAVPDTSEYEKAEVASASLARAVRQAAIVSDMETHAVDLRIFDGAITVSSQCVDVGKSRIRVPIEYAGPMVEVRCDFRFLLDFLDSADSDVSIAFKTFKQPVVLTEGKFMNVVMPLAKGK